MRQQWTLGGGFVPGAAIGGYHVLGLLGVGGMTVSIACGTCCRNELKP